MNCPSCGAQMGFRSERAPYTVCSSCQTMVLRKNLNLEALGKVAECQPDGSPVMLGTQGNFRGKSFEVIGRIQLAYEGGFWNEWYLIFTDGNNGWLGEALGQYFVSFQEDDASKFQDFGKLQLGAAIEHGSSDWIVLDKKTVRLSTFEGELPHIISDQSPFVTVDLRNADGEGLTVDFSGGETSLFRGRWVPFSELKFSGLQRPADPMVAVPSSETVAVKCPSCGAPHEISAPGRAQLLVCQFCDSSLDASTPELRNLGKMMDKAGEIAKWARIPIGTLAQLEDGQYKVIGMMQSYTRVNGVTYRWKDYLLYNHLTGYRWVNENNGHYMLFTQLYNVPVKRQGFSITKSVVGLPPQSFVHAGDEKFLHFSTADIQVEKVVGEFYWRVAAGDSSVSYDYINPPELLSASVTKDDITWTKGRYLEGEELARTFPSLDLSSEIPNGVAAAQPNPYLAARKSIRAPLWIGFFAAIFLIGSGLFLPKGQKDVNSGSVVMRQGGAQKQAASDPTSFTLEGQGRRDIAIEVSSGDLKNAWVEGNVTLVGTRGYRTGRKFILADFKETHVTSSNVVFSNVPAGEPMRLTFTGKTGPPTGETSLRSTQKDSGDLMIKLNYKTDILPGKKNWGAIWYYGFLILIPIWWLRSGRNRFEKKRWYESDYG